MSDLKRQIKILAKKYHLQLIYAFGSRAKEIFNKMEGKKYQVHASKSDLDVGVKPERPLSAKEKVNIAIFFEDLFDLPKVDVVVIPEASISLALEIVHGELLYTHDETYEAEYQLYIMRQAAELIPYERQKKAIILGI